MNPADPIITPSDTIASARSEVRILIDSDPVSGIDRQEAEGIQVGDGDGFNEWDPHCYDYANNGRTGVQVAADRVDRVELPKPGLIIGADLIQEHRQALRNLTEPT